MGDILHKFRLESINLRQFLIGDLQVPFLLDQLSVHRLELLAGFGLYFVDRFLLFHDEDGIHVDRNQGEKKSQRRRNHDWNCVEIDETPNVETDKQGVQRNPDYRETDSSDPDYEKTEHPNTEENYQNRLRETLIRQKALGENAVYDVYVNPT